MADYIITFPNGDSHTIQSGTIDNTYDVPLVGQDAINYGDDFATAAIRLLSNFADENAPSFGTNRVEGQLWYDTTPSTGGLKVYDGASWDTIALSSGVVTTTGNQSIDDTKTFTSAPAFTAVGEPFTVSSTTTVANLSAELLDGLTSTAFATAAQGTKADAAEVNIGNPPIDGYLYSSTAAGTRSWVAPSAGGGGIDPDDIGSAGSPTAMSLVLADHPTDPGQTPYTDGNLTFDGVSNILSCPNFVGSLTGNATTATTCTGNAATATVATTVAITDEASETTAHPLFVNTATGSQAVHSSDGISYNADSEVLTVVGGFSGPGSNISALDAGNISAGTLPVTRGGTGVNSSTGTGNTVRSANPTFTGTVVMPLINAATGVVLQWNGSNQFGSQDRTANGNTSGAFVFDAGGNNRDVGFNQMDTEDFASSAGVTLFDRDSAGHSYRSTHSTGEKIYQTEATLTDTDIPNGSMWIVRNFSTSTGTVKIQGGTGSTVRHYNGSGTILDTSGSTDPFFLARGGVATIVKVADSEYEMWGIGITGGA